MNVAINYKQVDSPQNVEKEVKRQIAKLSKLLKHYADGLVQLHGTFTKNLHNHQESCSLTISLPSGQLHATGSGRNALAGCKQAFSEIESQLKKHQALLRREHLWERREPST